MRAARAAGVLVVLATGLSACVDDSPIVTTGRDAGAAPSAPPPIPGDLPPSDPATCLTCGDTITRGVRPGACRSDGNPGSAALLGAYVDCVCRTSCTEECSLHCGGVPADATCAKCVTEKCGAAERSCRAGSSR
ncbi:MAG: hypothetical protein IPK71_00730 [Myxococcales bacterium]|nr:hypothetical protein [Myxococcales bacterium]